MESLEQGNTTIDAVGETSIGPKLPQAAFQDPGLKRFYLLLPAIFLGVTLLGGIRLGAADNAFLFLKPALVCLVFASITLVLFARSGLIDVGRWFRSELGSLHNVANAAVLLTFFTATVQLYNSLLPERGLTFWIFGFCFFWTLWTNLFAEFDARRLVRTSAAMFGLAFTAKYLVLANLVPEQADNWLQRLLRNPGQEAFTWLLDLPRYAEGTGYIQFFTLTLYLAGLFLMPRRPVRD